MSLTGSIFAAPSAEPPFLGNYQLNGTTVDTEGGASLVLTDPSGLTDEGYVFSKGDGATLQAAIEPDNYSIEIDFSIDAVTSYRKLIDFRELSSDFGLYVDDGKLHFYDVEESSTVLFQPGGSYTLRITRDGDTGEFAAYVDGELVFSFDDNLQRAVFPNSVVSLFLDDEDTQNEETGGALHGVRIYDPADPTWGLDGTGSMETLEGFDPLEDAIDVSGLGIADFATVEALLASDGSDTTLFYKLAGIVSGLTFTAIADPAVLTAANFVFSTDDSNDRFSGYAGDDDLFGGLGRDKISAEDGDDRVFGEGGDDALRGMDGDDSLFGGADNDRLKGGAGADSLEGGEGNDVLEGGNQDDVLDGGLGNDRLDGGGGSDMLFGGEGSDTIDGGNGADTVDGGDGADNIDVGHGDVATGGAGADSFRFLGDFGVNTITDFEDGADLMRLTGLRDQNGGAAISIDQLLVEQQGSHTTIELDLDMDDVADTLDLDGDGDSDNARIMLRDFSAGDLDASDFIF